MKPLYRKGPIVQPAGRVSREPRKAENRDDFGYFVVGADIFSGNTQD
jgi:hypothetical protein